VAVNVGVGVGVDVGGSGSVVTGSVVFGKSVPSDVAEGFSANGVSVVQAVKLPIPNRVRIIIIRVKFIVLLNRIDMRLYFLTFKIISIPTKAAK
jgi:hypothetical protein